MVFQINSATTKESKTIISNTMENPTVSIRLPKIFSILQNISVSVADLEAVQRVTLNPHSTPPPFLNIV